MAGEGFVIPISIEGVNSLTATLVEVNKLNTGLVGTAEAVSLISREAAKAQAALDKLTKAKATGTGTQGATSGTAKVKTTAPGGPTNGPLASGSATINADVGGLPSAREASNHFEALLRRTREELVALDRFIQKHGDNALGQLADEQARIHALTADYRLLLKLKKEQGDLDAKLRAYQSKQGSQALYQITEAKEYVKALEQIGVARAKLSERNMAATRNLSDLQNQLIPLKEELKLRQQLATLRARRSLRESPSYQKETAELQQLSRAEMQHVETSRAIEKAYRDVARARALLSKEYQDAVAQSGQLTAAERKQAQEAKLLVQWQNKVARAQAMTSKPVQDLIKEYNTLTHHVNRATGASKAFSEQITGTNQITAGFRAALAGVGMGFGIYTSATILAATATYSFVAALRDVVDSGSEFEKEMARVSAAMGLTEEQTQDLTNRANEMANSSRYAATDIVKAYREMAMSGFTYKETVDGIHSVLKMASIGMMEFGQAADIATNVLYGFNLDATDLAHVVDVLATTVTRSAQDLEQLGTAMSYIAPIASSFGLSLETTAAATEVLANAGIKSSRAGTGMRRTLTALFSDSEKVTKELKELGVTVNTMAYDMDEEFLRVLKELNTSTNGATTNIGNLSRAVGLYATPAFLNLVKAAGSGKDSLESILKAYKDVGGAASEMQARMEEALKVDWEEALAALSAIKNELYAIFGADLRTVLQEFTAWLRGVAESKDAIREVVSEFKELLTVVGTIAATIAGAGLLKGAGKMAAGVIDVAKGYRAAAGAKDAVGAGTALAAGVGATAGVKALGDAAEKSIAPVSKLSLASKTLSVAMRGAGWVGLALLLKDVWDIYKKLNEVVPQQTDNLNKQARAQAALTKELGAYLRTRTARTVGVEQLQDLNQSKQVLTDAEANVKKLEARINALIQVAQGQEQVTPALVRRLDAAAVALVEAQEALETAKRSFFADEASYTTKQLERLQDLKIELEVEIRLNEASLTEAQKELEEANKNTLTGLSTAMEDAKKAFDALDPIAWAAKGFPDFKQWLATTNPQLAEAANKVEALQKAHNALKYELNQVNDDLNKHGTELKRVGQEAAQQALNQNKRNKDIEQHYANAKSLVQDVRRSTDDLTTANRLEASSTEEKLAHYNKLIKQYQVLTGHIEKYADEMATARDNLETLKQLEGQGSLLRDEIIRQMKEMGALNEDLSAEQQEQQIAQWQSNLAAMLAGFDVVAGLVASGKEEFLGWLDAVFKLTDGSKNLTQENDRLTDSLKDLRQALFDLFNTADESDFADTLSGRLEKAFADSEALRRSLERTKAGTASTGGVLGVSGRADKDTKTVEQILRAYGATIEEASKQFGVDQRLIVAVIKNESSGNPNAISRAGAQGLMQVMPATGRSLGLKNSFDPVQNIMAGTKYLAQISDKRNTTDPATLAALYHAGINKDLSRLIPDTKEYAANVQATFNAIKDTGEAAAGAVDTATTAIEQSTSAVSIWANASTMSSEEQAAALRKLTEGWKEANQREVGLADQANLEDQINAKLLERINLDHQLKGVQERLEQGATLTEEEVEQVEQLIEQRKELTKTIENYHGLALPVAEELVRQNKAGAEVLDYNIDQMKELAEGFNSAGSRARKYYLVMAQIKVLEDKGLLTKTEAALQRINAELEKADPLTVEFSQEIVGALKNIMMGAESAKDAFANLKKTLVNLSVDKIAVPILMEVTTKTLDPLVKGFQDVMFGAIQGLGSMLLNSFAGLFGAATTAAGTGAKGAGGISNLFSVGGLTNLFGGNSMGINTVNAFGGGMNSWTGQMQPWATSLMNTPNWALAGGGIAGSLLGNVLFGKKGYGGIGSSIGGSAGSFGGAALAPLLGLTGPVGAILGGLLGGVGGGFLGSLFGDDEPKYGRLMADVGGRVSQLEDWENGPGNYAKGAFGLTFGLSDAATKNVKASEFKETFDAMAQMSNTLAEFYGPGLSRQIEEELANWPYLWGGEFENMGAAMADIFGNIADVAAQTGDETAMVFDALLGDLSGTEEEVANQIQKAMQATAGMIATMGQLMGTEIASIFGLDGTVGENAKELSDYLRQFAASGENSTDAVIRLTAQLAQFQFAVTQTGTSLDGLSKKDLVNLSDSLAKLFGGVEKMISYTTLYYEEFFSASEKATDAIEAVIKQLNTEFPKIKEKLDAMFTAGEFSFAKFALPDMSATFSPQASSDALADAVDRILAKIPGLTNLVEGTIFSPDTGDVDVPAFVKFTPQTEKIIADAAKGESVDAAKEVLRAVEAYYKGIELGSVTQSDEVEKRLTDAITYYADELKGLGLDLSRGLSSITGQLKDLNLSFLTEGDVESLTPDPNAFIYSALVADMPKTREAFNALVDQIDLTTEGGQTLYAELMKLAGAFDAMYDAIEGFEKWLGVKTDKELAKANLTKVFKGFGMELPATKDALLELYRAGRFTAEQLAILGANIGDLDLVYPDTADSTNPANTALTDAFSVLEQSIQKEKDAIDKMYNASREALENEKTMIDATYRQRMDAIADERDALQQAHNAAIDSYNSQREGAEEVYSAASSSLDSIRSAIDSLQGAEEVTAMDRARALRQLRGWAASGTLPDQEKLDKVLQDAIAIDKNDYATEAQYKAARSGTLSTLKALEKLADQQVSDAQRTIDAIEAGTDAATAAYEAQLDALDKAQESAEAWRKQELARIDQEMQALDDWRENQIATLDATLEEARKQVSIALGTWMETISVKAALDELNKLLLKQGATPVPLPPTTTSPPMFQSSGDLFPPLESLSVAAQATNAETVALKAEIVALRKDLALAGTAQVSALKSVDDRLRKWDLDGLPPGRDDDGAVLVRAA